MADGEMGWPELIETVLDWDDDGEVASIEIIDHLEHQRRRGIRPPTSAMMVEDGSLCLEWRDGTRLQIAEIQPNGETEYTYFINNKPVLELKEKTP